MLIFFLRNNNLFNTYIYNFLNLNLIAEYQLCNREVVAPYSLFGTNFLN